MNNWSEANFLERLMPPTQLKSSTKKDPCPEDELLVAFSENRLGGFVWDAVAEHLTRCVDCSELQHRMLKFSSASVAADQAEWGQTEKRLENWMDAFLQTHAAEVPVGEPAKPAVVIASREPVRNAPSWKFRWAWSAVAGLAAVACAVVVLEFVPALLHRGEPQVASQGPAVTTPQVAPQPVPPAEAVATPPESAENTAKTEPAATLTTQPSKPFPNIESPTKLSSSPSAAHRDVTSRDGAKLAAARQEPATEGNPQRNPADAALSTATHEASQLASAVGEVITSAAGDAQASQGSSRAVPASKSSSTATRAALPASISLLESTPIRIQLTSGSIPSDGRFEFRGTLLDPAIPVIGMVLGRDTEIRGVGTVQNGEISVVVNDVIIRGVHYPLKAGNGAAKAVRVGSGNAMQVSFGQGSVYEKVSRASGAPSAGSVAGAGDDGRF
ncbi:MAG: hypothetical protein WAL95_07870 [Candidatus Acidiferrales bacterium]